MTTSVEDDIDFKPFFDMVVGILFILLILISAQIFFAQHVGDDASQEAERRAIERERQTTAFLEDLTARLRAAGLDARLDRQRRAVSMPLGRIVTVAGNGIPQFADAPLAAIGGILAERLGCLVPVARTTCPDVDLLNLGAAEAELRLTGMPERTPVPQDRYAQFATTLLSAALLRTRPELLALTSSAGTPALRFSSATQAAAGQSGPAGDLSFVFVFQPR